MVQTAICLPKISQLFTIIFWTATNALYLTVWSWKYTIHTIYCIFPMEFTVQCYLSQSKNRGAVLLVISYFLQIITYIVSHQLHDSLFRCNFVEYLSATRIMTDKFTNIMTSHAQSLKKRFLNRLREYSI